MSADLYDRDVLAWSEHQAKLLRRLARGERVNELDWEHIVEEIEDVGLSELNAVRSYLRLMLVHLLKVQGWPDNLSIDHWRREIVSFQSDAAQRFAPSMRRRIAVAELYDRATRELAGTMLDGVLSQTWALACPVDLDDLLTGTREALEARFRAASSPPGA